eukprot:Anaeramoba_flamelloidesc36670_g2_i2.p1 GENE.c36670_g2_i2~~c36670_g2_i2.p1  ORF type:complete len:225 (+),score=22.94 c36670_g2_i2:222-896(+)
MLCQVADTLLGDSAFLDLAVQVGNHAFQLTGTFGNALFEHVMRPKQLALMCLALGNVHEDPDTALIQIVRVDRLAAQVAPEAVAILAQQLNLGAEHFAPSQHLSMPLPRSLPGLGGGVEGARAQAGQLIQCVAEHIGHALVAATDSAMAHEGDAHHGVVQNQLLLMMQGTECLIGTALLVDILNDPDRAQRGCVGADKVAGNAAPERGTVTTYHLQFGAEALPA